MGHNTTISSLVESTKGSLLFGSNFTRVKTITTDSRDIGEECLFIPIIGEKFDGHDFIDELVNGKKIAAFLTMKKEHKALAERNNVDAIFCNDTRKAYGRIASEHRNEINPFVIGITGTNGKTTTKELIWSILNKKHPALKNIKNYNNDIGVPYTLLGLRKNHKWAVIEMGMNHLGEIEQLSEIAKPDIALITNIGEGHLEFLENIENVALAKSEIMHGMKKGSKIFINRDSQCYEFLFEKAKKFGLMPISFGLIEEADIFPESYIVDPDKITLRYKREIYEVPIFGIHNIYNTLAAIGVAESQNISSDAIKEAFVNFNHVEKRGQIINSGFIVINDTYNSNPLSSKFALQSLASAFPEKRKIAVFSDMKELGSSSGKYHFDTGTLICKYKIDKLYTFGEMAEKILEGALKTGMDSANGKHFQNKNELIDFLRSNLSENDAVLIKGSRSMKMEEVVDAIIH